MTLDNRGGRLVTSRAMTRPKYTSEFRKAVVQLTRAWPGSREELPSRLGVSRATLFSWLSAAAAADILHEPDDDDESEEDLPIEILEEPAAGALNGPRRDRTSAAARNQHRAEVPLDPAEVDGMVIMLLKRETEILTQPLTVRLERARKWSDDYPAEVIAFAFDVPLDELRDEQES